MSKNVEAGTDDFEDTPKTPEAIRELVESYKKQFPPGSKIEVTERSGDVVEKIVMRYEASSVFALNKVHFKNVKGKGNTALHIGILRTAKLLEKEADPVIAITAEYEDRVRTVVHEFLTKKSSTAVIDIAGDGGYIVSEIMVIMRRKKKQLIPDAVRNATNEDIIGEAEEILRNRRK